MQKNTTEAFSHLFIIIGLFLIFSFIASGISLLPLVLFGLNIQEYSNFLFLQTHPYGRYILLYLQAVIALGGFLFTSWIYLKYIERKGWQILQNAPVRGVQVLFLASLITLVVMPFNSLLVEWNLNLKFPTFLQSFEQWASEQEKTLAQLTYFLTNFKHWGELLLGLVVIAIIPAIGEELLFRGLIQRNLMKALNPHLSIWLTGIIFSAIHLQFYGFLPRMVLGVLFGYLYFWSGNLWTSIVAHFINNGITLLAVYLFNQKITNLNLEHQESMPLPIVMASFILTCVLIYGYVQYIQKIRKFELDKDLNI